MKKIVVVYFLLMSTSVFADTYEVGAGTGGNISIYNVDSKQAINLNLAEIFNYNNPYGNLDPDGDPNDYSNEISYNGGNEENNTPESVTDVLGLPQIKDISGDNILVESRTDAVVVGFEGGEQYNYGRRAIYNIATEQIVDDTLLTSDQSAYDYALSNGYDVELIGGNVAVYSPAYGFSSYSTNSLNVGLTNGGFQTNQVTSSNGDSMIRSETDGTVHIGNNSFVFAESGTNGFKHDTVYSSLSTLQIGDSANHRTIVRGTLEIQDPTQPNHAVTKRYSDSSNALAMAIAALPRSVDGRPLLSMGTGYLGGESAFAFGFSQSNVGSGISFNANLGYSQNTDVGLAMGVGYSF